MGRGRRVNERIVRVGREGGNERKSEWGGMGKMTE